MKNKFTEFNRVYMDYINKGFTVKKAYKRAIKYLGLV